MNENDAPTPDQIRKNLEGAMRNYSANKEHFETLAGNIAELYYAFYLAYVKSGFTKEQALDIIKARGAS